jgi:hypothetical protein
MSCTRCGGTVVIEEFLDDKGSSLGFEGLRCLNCGHIEDSVIHSNRGGGAVLRPSRHDHLLS